MKKFKELFLEKAHLHEMVEASVELSYQATGHRLFLKFDSKDNLLKASFTGKPNPWLSSLCALLPGKNLGEASSVNWKSWEDVFKQDQTFWEFRQEEEEEFIHESLELLHTALDVFRGREYLYEESSPLICRCFGIRESDILQHLQNNEAPTLEGLTSETKAGMGCRTCVPQLKRWVSAEEDKKNRHYKHRPVSDWLIQIDHTLANFPEAKEWKMEIQGMKNQQVQISFDKDVTQREEELAAKKLQDFLAAGVDTGLTFFLRRARHFSKAKG